MPTAFTPARHEGFSVTEPAAPSAAATNVRWYVLTVATLSSVLLYLDRISANFVVESIRLDFGLTQQQMGLYLAAFFWSYALGQVPAGWISDRLGIRWTLTAYILFWSAFTALLGLSTGLITLLIFRLGCGFAQAGAYPACGRAVRDWMPLTQRGMASSVVAFGGRVGGAIAPLLTAAVMLWLALSGRDARFRPDEIVAPDVVVERLIALEGQADEADAQPIPEWQRILKQAGTDTDVAAQIQRERGSNQTALDPRFTTAVLLNEIEPLAVLSARSDLDSLGLPAQLRLRIDRFRQQASPSVSTTQLANRQFWETMFPSAVKKVESRGWRMTLVLYGLFGIVVAGVFWVVFRNQPEQHPWCNAAEVAAIGNVVTTPKSAEPAAPFPWTAILTDIGLWGNCLCQFGTNIGWLFLVTWFARHLDEVHQVPVIERGFMVSLPIFAGMFGMLAGGPLTDRLTTRLGLKWGRRIPIASSRVIAASGYILCVLATTGMFGELGTRGPAWITVTGLAIVAISTDLGVAATWAYAQDIAGRHTAAVLGWGNMWGNLGAAVAPPLYNLILGEKATLWNWNMLFVFCGGAFLVSAIGGWLMDSSHPLEAVDDTTADEA